MGATPEYPTKRASSAVGPARTAAFTVDPSRTLRSEFFAPTRQLDLQPQGRQDRLERVADARKAFDFFHASACMCMENVACPHLLVGLQPVDDRAFGPAIAPTS